MLMKSPSRLACATVGVAAALTGGFYAGSAVAGTNADTHSTNNLPINDSGQTYGVDNGVGARPDLLLVEATNGQTGYVVYKELDALTGANLATLEEVVAWEQSLDSATWTSTSLPVYKSDGKNKIGEFEVSRGDVSETPPAGPDGEWATE